jgi:hypothetical protein
MPKEDPPETLRGFFEASELSGIKKERRVK